MKTRSIFVGACATLFFASAAFADMGRVYYSDTGVKVSEDAQKAIILHNNTEEVLILGTELSSSSKTPIIRFIPFPSEPEVSLAPKGVFDRLAMVVAKYKLSYFVAVHSKGGKDSFSGSGVDVRLNAKLGAHDLTVLRVRDATAFRGWVNAYFKKKGLPHAASYQKEEAIVADYVKRGIDYFVLDAVELPKAKQYVDPVVYKFKSTSLYYPLKTSNTFGGKGEIELFIASPATLCMPGSNIFMEEGDKAVGAGGLVAGPCLNILAKASSSVRLVPEEADLRSIYPEAETFFGKQPVFLQSIRYVGAYHFDADIVISLPQGTPRALHPEASENPFAAALGLANESCRKKPDPGICKGNFEKFYFDERSRSCKVFFWGGCQGVVPFETIEECKKACEAP